MIVIDSSAVLAFLQGEEGAERVEAAFPGATMSAANWSEVAQKVIARGGDWSLVKGLLLSYGLVIESVSTDDAERAAMLWKTGSGLSLADRLCLAAAQRLQAVALTADREWGDSDWVKQIR